MDVEIDISENLKRTDKDSFLGVSTKDETYQRSVQLSAAVKRKIRNYHKYREEIHSALIYFLIVDELEKYTSIKICPDVSRRLIHNNLLSLLKNNETYRNLLRSESVRISPVGHGKKGVDNYVKNLKKRKIEPTKRILLQELQDILLRFRNIPKEK